MLRRAVLPVLVIVVAGLLALPALPSLAADPESGTVSPSSPQASWTGGPLAVSNGPAAGCEVPESCDTFTLTVDTGGQTGLDLVVGIESQDIGANIDLIVQDDQGTEIASSRSDGASEEVRLTGVSPGTYLIVESTEVATPDSVYAGNAKLVDPATEIEDLPAPADAQGLEFSASTVADIQRDEGEPIIEIDPGGTIYTCGPTGFSQAEDYAQSSIDGGDQFHLLGEPPRGQQSLGGGGDCALATAPVPNDDGQYNVAYVGLSGLLNFTVARSSDSGRTWEASPISQSIPGVDRQWLAFSDQNTVFLNYNQQAPRAVMVQKSTDAGLTYGAPVSVSPNPGFPGPIRALPADLNPGGDVPAIYYPWNEGNTLRLAVSLDNGDTWNNCTIAEAPGNPSNSFPVADHDAEGNLYIAYTEASKFNTYLVTAPPDVLLGCDGGTTNDNGSFDVNPGFSEPVLVNRGDIQSTVFPWLAAGGQPGRVAIAFYGSPVPARPDDAGAPHTWNVYVNQSLDALSAAPHFSQVRATTHPNHYDQICLLGVGCTAGGDRSLVDFFALDYNAANGELVVVYNRAHKRPGDTTGLISTPVVVRQIAGPSNGGGTVDRAGRAVLRTSATDPTGDALADYSSLYTPPQTTNVPAADVTAVEVVPAIDPATEEPSPDGGFTVRITVDDLSDAALQTAMSQAGAQSLLWIFRYVDGYRYSAASARWDPVRGFTFGHNGYEGSAHECGTAPTPPTGTGQVEPDQCLYYRGTTAIAGLADQESGVITMTVPLELLSALDGEGTRTSQPQQVAAEVGDRIYTAAVYSQANPTSTLQEAQSFLYPLDNSPSMDFLVPGAATPGGGGGGGTTTGGGTTGGAAPGGETPSTPVTGGGLAVLGLGLALLGSQRLRRRR